MCFSMFIAALFTIARACKQPRCLLADKQTKKQWYIYIIEYYSTIKMNAFESVLMRWMKLKPIIQSEASQKEKQKTVNQDNPEGLGGEEDERGFQDGGTHVPLWLIHVTIWEKNHNIDDNQYQFMSRAYKPEF